MLHLVVILEQNEVVRTQYMDQSNLRAFYDDASISFCGAIDDCHCVCVKRANRRLDSLNSFAVRFPKYFDADTYGDVLVVGSDARGEACDVDVVSLSRLLDIAIPPQSVPSTNK